MFIDHVKKGRRGRLKAADEVLFTGEWWTGIRGVDLGLVDALGDLHGTLRQRYGDRLELKVIEPKRPWFGIPRIGFAAALTADLSATLEDKALWARLGL